MVLYTLIDPTLASQLSVHKDYIELAKRLGYEHIFYTIEQFHDGRVEPDSRSGLFIFEGALLKESYRTTKDIKTWFPNCKIVALTGESLTYKHGYAHYTNNPTREFEFYDGYDIDLWLDGNDEIVEDYRKKGLTVDYWMWTVSQFMIDLFLNRPRIEKYQDIVCLIGHKREYRQALMGFMNGRYRCQWGSGAGDGNYDFDHLFNSFSGSRFVLGTSSPCWWTNRSVKGFRDWLGPICGTVLIYDDYPDVVKKYPCPIYPYEDFQAISELMEGIWSDQEQYNKILAEQVAWAQDNTIVNQLQRRLTQYKLI